MFEGAFSFRGRIGRLKYLVGQLMLMPVAFVIGIVVVTMIATAQRTAASLVFFVLLGLAILVGLVWYSLSLQVRRIRDIGWSPVIVLGGFFFLLLADAIVARAIPSLAIGHGSTLFGVLLNLALTAALYLWPGNGDIDTYKMASIAACFDEPEGPVAPMARIPSPMPALAAAGPVLSVRTTTVPRKTFGKRGLR